MNTTAKLQSAFSITRARSWDGVCWSGQIFSGPTNAVDRVVRRSEAYRMVSTRKADEWYWGQCGLKNRSFGATLVVLLLGGTVGVALLFRALSGPSDAQDGGERGDVRGVQL
jgi:hypothetical protein